MIIKNVFFIWLLLFFDVHFAYPFTSKAATPNRKDFDKEVFVIGEKNSTFVFPQNFTVKRNSVVKFSIANNEHQDSGNQTTLRSTNDHRKPICKEEVNSFCTEIDNYPSENISSILDNLGVAIESYFGDDIISEKANISQRMHDEETLCRSKEQLIHPKGFLGVDGNFEYIVNDDHYRQGIRIEQCVYTNKNDKRCQMTDSFPNGYVTECKQRYISRRLLTYNVDGRTIEKKLFKIPSCCQCVIRNEH